jgi:hypothetical protein
MRKIVGTILLLALIAIYAPVAVTIASAQLEDASQWTILAYFLVTGLLWLVPAMFLIRWMIGPGKRRQ